MFVMVHAVDDWWPVKIGHDLGQHKCHPISIDTLQTGRKRGCSLPLSARHLYGSCVILDGKIGHYAENVTLMSQKAGLFYTQNTYPFFRNSIVPSQLRSQSYLGDAKFEMVTHNSLILGALQ